LLLGSRWDYISQAFLDSRWDYMAEFWPVECRKYIYIQHCQARTKKTSQAFLHCLLSPFLTWCWCSGSLWKAIVESDSAVVIPKTWLCRTQHPRYQLDF
jgi:hypothetical protein